MNVKYSGPEANLGAIFRVRRNLLEPIKNGVLANSRLGPDAFDLLLELFRIRQGWEEISADPEGFTTFKELERRFLNSQAHISRRVKKVQPWVESRRIGEGGQHHANSRTVRINAEGIKKIRPVWDNYRQLADTLFQSIGPKDREIHYRVTQMILDRLRPYRSISPLKQPPRHPVENIIAVLKAARELIAAGPRKELLVDTGLPLEKVEILIDLYGAWKLSWPDPKADDDGFVTIQRMQASLVHNIHPSQAMLSRRIRALKDDGLLVIQNARENLNEKDRLRITEKGIKTVASPVWERYQELAARLMLDATQKEREVHKEVNERILERLRPAWAKLV